LTLLTQISTINRKQEEVIKREGIITMAQPDVQWPSEDEDFDAVSNGKPVAVAEPDEDDDRSQDRAPKQSSTSGVKSVKVISDVSQEEEEEPEPEESVNEAASDDEAAEPTEESRPDEEEAAPDPELESQALLPEEHQDVSTTPSATPKTPKTSKANLGRVFLEVILFAGVVGLGLWAWTLHSDNSDLQQQVSKLNANPQVAIQKQTNQLISAVGQLMQLPTGETPTIANVSDASQAKQQSAFFNNAQNGDKVLMYVKAGQAILYRPSTNKIILVAPLTFTGSSTAASTPTTPKTTTPTDSSKTTQ
jgi:hypothetical protein